MSKSVLEKRLYWHSRRGMLELDLVLVPFFEACYANLSPADQQRYQQLLSCEDQDLFSWFLGRVQPEDPELKIIVDLIHDFARKPAT